MIQAGLADALLVGGADAPICPSIFAAFDRLGMMPKHFNENPRAAIRPFDVRREGLVLGEGAAVLLVESERHARERDAAPIAELAGYGSTCDAKSHFHQEKSGSDAVRAIRQAIGRDTDAVDYVNAHGTGTRENDPFEARVLRLALGQRMDDIPISASKSQFGHLLGACGAVEAAVVLASMDGHFVPATLNLVDPDPECRLSHVTAVTEASIRVALSTSFGFGSRNAALVLKRWEGWDAGAR
jgi:3-oxoacyl-[acyl-carrier-protein] synthase II